MNGTTRSLRMLALLLPLMVLALGSFWLVEVMQRAMDDASSRAERSEPDFYVEEFTYVRMAANGQPRYRLSGTRLTHNPQDGSYDVLSPLVTVLSNPALPVTLRSARAHINGDGSEVHLYDHAKMTRAGNAKTAALRLESEYLLMLPNDDVVRTDTFAKLSHGTSILTGTGMIADNANRVLRVLNNVHGTYQPPAR